MIDGRFMFGRFGRGAIRRVAAALLTAAAIAASAGLAAAQSAPSGIQPTTRTLLVFGQDQMAPALFTGQNGEPQGILLELWELWAKQSQTRYQFKLLPWSELLQRFRQGEGDLIFGIIKTPEREGWLDFTDSFFMSRLEVYVHAGAPPDKELADLTGKRIGVVKDDYSHIYLAGHLPRGAVLTPYSDLTAMIKGASGNQVDAFLGYQFIVDYGLAQQNVLKRFRSLPTPCATFELHGAVRKGDAQLLAALNRGLARITQDERDAVTMQWKARPLRDDSMWKGVLGVAGGVLFIGGALGLMLRRRTALRLASLMRGLRQQEQEKQEAVAGMRFNEQRLSAFTETLSGILFILDHKGVYIDIFGSEDQLLAAPRERLLNHTVEEALPPEAAVPIMKAVRGAIQSRMLHEVEYSLNVPAGRRTFEGRVSYIHESSPDRPMVVFLALDVTEQKQLAEQLRQAQKMEAIGRLAGGVAHDFNNILTAIIGFAGIAAEDINDPASARQHIEEIRAGAERAAALTRQLLAFSRRQSLSPVRLDLNQVVVSMEKMLRRLIGDDVVLKTDLAANLEPVLADPSQIDQVMLNLAVNGRDAMPHGGTLALSTRNLDLSDQSFGPTAMLRSGVYVVLEVADSGVGMDESTRLHVFEPFFTTKDRDKGTGLGLSTVYGIVKQSGGDIDCISRPGQGTTFRIYLPRTLEPGTESSLRTSMPNAPAQSRGDETLAVVEDDATVRALVCRVLRANGYTVLEAADAPAALELFEREGEGVRLLLTDVVMPGMRGPELARRLASGRPRLKVLFMSGYTDGELISPDAAAAGVDLLLKPFRAEELLTRVRTALEKGA